MAMVLVLTLEVMEDQMSTCTQGQNHVAVIISGGVALLQVPKGGEKQKLGDGGVGSREVGRECWSRVLELGLTAGQ
jgi:hypothetical protein